MSLNIQIGNAEVVNLLVVQRVAELELEIEAKVKERELLGEQKSTLGREMCEEIQSDIRNRYLPEFKKVMEPLCEFHEEFPDWDLEFYSLSLTKPQGTVMVSVRLAENDSGDYVQHDGTILSDEFETAVDGLKLEVGYTVPEAKRALYVALDKKCNAAYRYINEREELIKNRDDMGRKMLAAFTAKTLAANPEHYANVLSAVKDVAGGQLFLGSAPVGVTVDGTVVEEVEDQTSGD